MVVVGLQMRSIGDALSLPFAGVMLLDEIIHLDISRMMYCIYSGGLSLVSLARLKSKCTWLFVNPFSQLRHAIFLSENLSTLEHERSIYPGPSAFSLYQGFGESLAGGVTSS